jgi:H+/Cl- antiporter ClcA
MTSAFPDGVNAFGATMFVAFLLCSIGAGISGVIMKRAGDPEYFNGKTMTPEARGRFLRFFMFCLAGVLCGLAGFAFGGWPTDQQ